MYVVDASLNLIIQYKIDVLNRKFYYILNYTIVNCDIPTEHVITQNVIRVIKRWHKRVNICPVLNWNSVHSLQRIFQYDMYVYVGTCCTSISNRKIWARRGGVDVADWTVDRTIRVSHPITGFNDDSAYVTTKTADRNQRITEDG